MAKSELDRLSVYAQQKEDEKEAAERPRAQEAGPAPMVRGPLPEYFSCLDNGSFQTLRCVKCGKGYKVPLGSVHPGNRIALMNHVRTHSELEEL